MPLVEALIALAALAGNTVVTAAVTDAWGTAKKGFARLLGRSDPDKTKAAERRLEETRDQLTNATGADLARLQVALEGQWTTRLADLLEDDPGVEATCMPWWRRSRRRCGGRSFAGGRAGHEHQRWREHCR